MKHLIRNALVTVLGIGLVGCEWSGGGDDNSWSDSNSIANFNGSYRGNGSYLVSEYTLSSTSTGSDTIYTQVNGESTGSAASGNTTFSGDADHVPIKTGSVTLSLSGDLGSFTDDGSGRLSGQYHTRSGDSFLYNATGTINYDNGQWTLTLAAGAPLGENSSFSITYSYSAAGSGSGGGSSGTSGASIYSFNVQQTGNKLTIIDNNGSVYKGSFGDVKTTGNLGSTSSGAEFVNGDQVIGSFSASGTSAAGIHVNMTGTFQGTAAGVTKVSTRSGDTVTYTTSMALTDRQMMGTWIEDGGKTGNISGYCPSAVNVSSGTTTAATAM